MIVFWNATDANTGVQGYQYKVDSDAYSAISSSISQRLRRAGRGIAHGLDQGVRQCEQRRHRSVTFMVDTVKPMVTVTSPTEALLTNSAVVTWTGSDATSGILNYQSCVDGGAWSAPSGSLTRTFALADGTHRAGPGLRQGRQLRHHVPELHPGRNDPSIVISAPASLAMFNVTSVTVNWNGTDNLAGILGYQYKLDGAAYSGTIGANTFTFTGLSDMLHTVIIKAIDNASNSQTATIQFRVDTIAPALVDHITGQQHLLDLRDRDRHLDRRRRGSGVQGYQYRIDGGAWSTLSLPTVSHTFTGLLDGSPHVDVRAFDNGNKVSIKSVTFTVDTVTRRWSSTTRPTCTSPTRPPVKVYWNGSDATSGILRLRVLSSTARIFTCTCWPRYSTLFTRTDQRQPQVDIRAVDKAGLNDIKSVNVTVDNVIPALTISAPAGGAYLGLLFRRRQLDGSPMSRTSVSGYQYRSIAERGRPSPWS